jgi:hypothetical protein
LIIAIMFSYAHASGSRRNIGMPAVEAKTSTAEPVLLYHWLRT